MVGLGDLPGGFYGSGANKISSDGSTIVGFGFSGLSGGSIEAFRWTDATGFRPLGDLPGGYFASDALAVNADGSVVLGFSNRDTGNSAFVWDGIHGMRDLRDVLTSDYALGSQLAGWQLVSAADISDDGLSIVGTGINPNGDYEAWLVRLDRPLGVPEPEAILLAIPLIASLSSFRWRRQIIAGS